jgi:hypothetical protein
MEMNAVLKSMMVTAVVVTSALAQAGGARVFGRLTNGAGDPIPNTVIVLCNADANLWFMTSTDGKGAFELTQLPANRFAIEILSPQWRRPTSNPASANLGIQPLDGLNDVTSRPESRSQYSTRGPDSTPTTSQGSPPCTPRRSRLSLGAAGLARLLVEQTAPVYP